MLDTRMTPISTRPRRPSSARPELRSERLHVRPSAPVASALRQPAAEPTRRALPSARTSRLAQSEMRLMGLATACTAVACALLLVYLAAYAHVTQLGIAQAAARTQLHQNQIRNELLQAERNSLECPQRIETAALALGMTPRGATPVNYVRAQKYVRAQNYVAAQTETKSDMIGQPGAAAGGEQGNSGGTTKDSGAAASGDH